MSTIWQTMKKDYLRVIIAGALVWPPAQMVNFLVVPLPYRVLFINVIGLGWSTYTSFVASRGYDRQVLPLPLMINPLYGSVAHSFSDALTRGIFTPRPRATPVPPLPYLPIEIGLAPPKDEQPGSTKVANVVK